MRPGLAVAAMTTIPVAGCGGGSTSREDDVKAVSIQFVEAILDERNGLACALTTNVGDCIAGLALAQGFLGEGGVEAVLGDNWRDELENADVTFHDDDRATIEPITGLEPIELVRQDGKWLIAYDD
jgi:hypothetical protein